MTFGLATSVDHGVTMFVGILWAALICGTSHAAKAKVVTEVETSPSLWEVVYSWWQGVSSNIPQDPSFCCYGAGAVVGLFVTYFILKIVFDKEPYLYNSGKLGSIEEKSVFVKKCA